MRLFLALYTILTRPSDPAHSEYNGVCKLPHSLLLKAILTPSAGQGYGGLPRFLVCESFQRDSKELPWPDCPACMKMSYSKTLVDKGNETEASRGVRYLAATRQSANSQLVQTNVKFASQLPPATS